MTLGDDFMNTHYTDEKNTLITIALLKAHGIKKVIASPGTTNIRLVASMQQDSFFEMYSAADERSAAYMACGLAYESGEPVVLTCTGATASRNYVPGLTEAFYRKLPVLAITSTQHLGRIGQNVAQVIDRSVQMNDTVRLSVQIPTCYTKEDEWAANVQINRAILELTRAGGGPAHINLETTYSSNFSVENLPEARAIFRIGYTDTFPSLPEGRIGIFVGAHKKWSNELTNAVDAFCAAHDAVVLCDQTSNYRGKYRVLFSLVTSQDKYCAKCNDFDLMIHIGDISGAYPYFVSREEWRVNPDGEIRDTFNHLKYVFEMDEAAFFQRYSEQDKSDEPKDAFFHEWESEYRNMYSAIKELPFSNIYIAKTMSACIPENSILHLGILNTLRSWNFFETPKSVEIASNTGGFGIDGIMSSAIGAALGSAGKPVFCIVGDLAFFYDMNSLGNHNVPSNIRIMLLNNGRGTEFRNYNHPGAMFGDDADEFIAAANHYGAKSKELAMHYTTDLGFEYLSACDKSSFEEGLKKFIDLGYTDKPMVFEVFLNWEDESNALNIIRNTVVDADLEIRQKVKGLIKGIIGQGGVETIKKITGRK